MNPVNFKKHTAGIILCGGESRRMGTDKSLLDYHGKPQRYHVYEMLESYCSGVYLSMSKKFISVPAKYNYLPDDPAYSGIGPMAGLLTAFDVLRTDILLIGCDYPFLTGKDISDFMEFCTGSGAAAFFNDNDMYEPLLAWYPANCRDELKERYFNNNYSLQDYLKSTGAGQYYPSSKQSMKSIDTMEGFLEARQTLNSATYYISDGNH